MDCCDDVIVAVAAVADATQVAAMVVLVAVAVEAVAAQAEVHVAVVDEIVAAQAEVLVDVPRKVAQHVVRLADVRNRPQAVEAAVVDEAEVDCSAEFVDDVDAVAVAAVADEVVVAQAEVLVAVLHKAARVAVLVDVARAIAVATETADAQAATTADVLPVAARADVLRQLLRKSLQRFNRDRCTTTHHHPRTTHRLIRHQFTSQPRRLVQLFKT